MEMAKDNYFYESLLHVFNGVSMSWMRKCKWKNRIWVKRGEDGS